MQIHTGADLPGILQFGDTGFRESIGLCSKKGGYIPVNPSDQKHGRCWSSALLCLPHSPIHSSHFLGAGDFVFSGIPVYLPLRLIPCGRPLE